MVSLEPIDLFQGRPAPDLLPTEHLKNAAVKALSDKSVSDPGLGYGPDEGYFPLRQNIASWLSAFYETQQPANAERICITGGASQNLNSILSVFTDPLLTRMVWLVEPTYHLVFRSFEDAGFHGRMRGIPEDEEGMDADALEGALGLFEEGEDSIPDMANVRNSPFLQISQAVDNNDKYRKLLSNPTNPTAKYTDMSFTASQVSRTPLGRR
jgi:histidinol-phosphate/aromatic aminotransferase/cobyric acid decarboxylase-like protein